MASARHIALISVHGDPAIEIGKEEAGGQNVYVRHVGESLAEQGWQVDMFTRKTDPNQDNIVEHRDNCRTIRLTAGPEHFVHRDNIFQYLPTFIDRLLQFQAESGVQYHLAHTNYWLSAWVGMQLKAHQPLAQVHTHHSLGSVKYRSVSEIPPIANTRLETEKRCIETADRVIATSPQEADDMRQVTQTGNIDVIPCGTDVHRFGAVSKDEARRELGISPDTKLVFYVGRFDPRKGIETLVRAVGRSQLRGKADLQLIVGGGSRSGHKDGDERDRLIALVRELGIEELVHFPGRIADGQMTEYYAAADVCVVPSHYEPFGLVAIEAMACRTPIVASAVGGLQYTVAHEETGLLVPAKDDAAFAEAIDRILLDSDWRDRLGNAARQRVLDRFSWESVAQQLGEVYSELLEESALPV
ncbi:glycoside hydrolase [Leptolyngbya valderiana BDU 20041]|nr:glycosyltransferase [Geitlerinema sp. CS-897]OAB62655.1 glycoside hydrolase [Leptolyngbya valderiana BDU 20041]PPT08589.1 Glycosyl transferase group 1 [Geitlerinema sp. FC II]